MSFTFEKSSNENFQFRENTCEFSAFSSPSIFSTEYVCLLTGTL